MTGKNPWPMLGYHAEPFDLDAVAWDVATLCSCNPTPYHWDRNRLEDGNGNEVIVEECLAAINAAPAMLLEIRDLRAKLRVAEEALEWIAEPRIIQVDWMQMARKTLAEIRETKCPSDLGPIRAVPQGREDGCELPEPTHKSP